MVRRIGISFLKILAFLLLWALLTAAATMTAVGWGGDSFYEKLPFRVGLEVALTITVLAATIIMARFVDKRPVSTIGFATSRLPDLLTGTVLGAAMFALPLAVLTAMGAARFDPDLGDFTAQALMIGVFVCFFNVVTQEVLARGYMFQELWGKYGPWAATILTSIFFVSLHAAPISQGTQGLVTGLNILIASLMLSLAYVRTGSLWLPVGIHLGWNGLQGPVLAINVSGSDLAFGHWRMFSFAPGDELMTGGVMGVEGGLVGLIGPAAGIVLVALLFKPQPKPDFSARSK